MLHLQIGGSGKHARYCPGREREAGGVHEVQQQGHAACVQPLWQSERKPPLTASTGRVTREDRVEESTVENIFIWVQERVTKHALLKRLIFLSRPIFVLFLVKIYKQILN